MALRDLLKRGRLGRRRAEPARDTIPFPTLLRQGEQGAARRFAIKPTPRNLRHFSRTPYARRAINAIKNPIAMLEWEIVPVPGVTKNREHDRQIELATTCFEHPNNDDSFRTLAEQVIEDVMLGAGAIETRAGGDPLRPLWLYPVDGLTIQINPGWDGSPDLPRYAQIPGYGTLLGGSGSEIWLRNDELIYIRPNPSTATPFGLGPLEVAFNSISRIIGVGEFAGNVASNARPSIGLDLGDGADGNTVAAFRAFWRDEVEGQGTMPIFGLGSGSGTGVDKGRGPSVMRLFPEGDGGLYLKWQEFLKSEIATAFDLSPQNLGVERDVNRNTAEVGQDRDRNNAIKPHAQLLAAHLTREALHGVLGFSQLMFRFKGLDPEDELVQSEIYEREYKNNSTTPNEYRTRRGRPPSEGPWGDLTYADVQIAMEAARGAAQVDDPDLPGKPADPAAPAEPGAKTAAKPQPTQKAGPQARSKPQKDAR